MSATVTTSTRNVTRVFRTATAEDRAAGRDWYRRASVLAAELAASLPTGHLHHGDADRAAAVIAVLSPRLSWPQNVKGARAVYAAAHGKNGATLQHPDGLVAGQVFDDVAAAFRGLRSNGVKAARLLTSDAPTDDIVSGPKVTAFYRTISDPTDPRAVVVDRHAIDVAAGRVTDDAIRGRILGRAGAYARVADHYARAARILTRELGEDWTPAEVQAVTWTAWRRTRAVAFHGGGD